MEDRSKLILEYTDGDIVPAGRVIGVPDDGKFVLKYLGKYVLMTLTLPETHDDERIDIPPSDPLYAFGGIVEIAPLGYTGYWGMDRPSLGQRPSLAVPVKLSDDVLDGLKELLAAHDKLVKALGLGSKKRPLEDDAEESPAKRQRVEDI